MGRDTRIAGLALWAGLLAWQSAEAQIPDRSIMRVLLTDLAEVPAGMLDHAKPRRSPSLNARRSAWSGSTPKRVRHVASS